MLIIKASNNGRSYEILVTGHCGYGEKGKDIACAGASTLMVSLAKTLEQYTEYLENEPYIIMQDGFAKFVFMSNKDGEDKINALYDMTIEGFEWLQDEFKKNVLLLM